MFKEKKIHLSYDDVPNQDELRDVRYNQTCK
jgi:hypothetical protein